MTKNSLPVMSFLALALGLGSACADVVQGPSPSAQTTGAIAVRASFVSATLADDCPREAGRGVGDCGSSADAGAAADGGGPPRFGCESCQQSNLQLTLEASAGEGAVSVGIVAVRLVDASTGEMVDQLSTREPQVWAEPVYRPWDGQLAASTTLRVSYLLSSPAWSRIPAGGSRWSYTRRFRLEVVLRIDGIERTITSGELTREPEVVT